MKSLSKIESNSDVYLGKDVYFDAWLYNFMIENNFAYHMNPGIIASPEQIAFMVALKEHEIYIPTSDAAFQDMMQPQCSSTLKYEYSRVWRLVMRLVRSIETKSEERQRILAFCRYRFRQLIKSHTILPARVMKRMTSLVAAQTGVIDPWLKSRRAANEKAQQIFQNDVLQRALYEAPADHFTVNNLADMRVLLDSIELSRLMYLSAMSYDLISTSYTSSEWASIFKEIKGSSVSFLSMLGIQDGTSSKIILFLPDSTGSFVLDVPLIRRLIRMGHKVIVAAKGGYYFHCPTIHDVEDDPVLKELLSSMTIVPDSSMSKNELLRVLRESRFVMIQDGTQERLNLYRTNVTFARAWKEADIILAKGRYTAETLLESSQFFTRDIVCYWRTQDGQYCVKTKARAEHVRKLSEADISERADGIISAMRAAHKSGKTVMFYSCIIGSIPGQESTAIALVRAFVESLRQKLHDTFIINPAEQSPDGMDGDDLMYMWEKVQRSGYINVWRFQTVHDIEDSFALLGRKVLPAWSGKDATYSTGCTQEMRIALDVQKKNPEMQIIGPNKEKFFRRDTYGVGKYFDARFG